MDAMIEVHSLRKTYPGRGGEKTFEAVRGIDLRVERGEIVGFLGPNGAGKTTTLRMLATLLQPTGGSARVAGVDLLADPIEVRRRIGYVAQMGTTDPDARAGEELVDHARLYGVPTKAAAARGATLLRELDLADSWRRKCGSLSGGQRRRLDIAMGLIHAPGLVFLDEPSTGLDPQSRANLWGHIRRVREHHETTVFITTHYMDEADALCDRIVIIDHGSIVATGTPAALKRQVGGDTLELTLESPQKAERAVGVVAAAIEGVRPEAHANHVRLATPNAGAALPRLLSALTAAGVAVAGVSLRSPTLDDVFLHLTGRSLREAAN